VQTIELEAPLAVFSDVHGNLPALEAILADIEARAVAHTLCLGDLVG
jgi:protein phosphatase